MSKLKKEELLRECAFQLQQILNMRVTSQNFFQKSFSDKLRNHIFKSQQEKDDALFHFCRVVFSNKSIHDAIHIQISGTSSEQSIPTEQSITKGLRNEIVSEFADDVGVALPRWYLQAKIETQMPDVPT